MRRRIELEGKILRQIYSSSLVAYGEYRFRLNILHDMLAQVVQRVIYSQALKVYNAVPAGYSRGRRSSSPKPNRVLGTSREYS